MVNLEKWSSALVGVAGLMGSAGVVIAAAGSHLQAGDSAHIAAEFLLIHAAVVFAAGTSQGSGPSRGVLAAASVLAVGCSIFSADLALAGLGNLRPLPLAAPVGGLGMIAGWLMLTAAGVWRFIRKSWPMTRR